MGLFDMFGAGGGSLEIQPTSPHASAGSAIGGNLVFMGGSRAQSITKLTLRLTMEQRQLQMTNQGMQPRTDTREVVPATIVAQAFTTTPGQPSAFPFQLPIPPGLPSTTPGAVTYHLRASADIDGEIDPGTSLEINVVGTGLVAMPPQGMHAGKDLHAAKGMHPGVPQQGMHAGKDLHAAKGMHPGVPQQGMHAGKDLHAAKGMHPGVPQQGMHPGAGKDLHAKGLGSVGDPPGIGSPVMAQHPHNQQWYPGRVVAMQQGMVGVDWDDPSLGQSSWVSPVSVRSR